MKKTDAISSLAALAHETRMDVFKLLVTAASPDPEAGGLPAGEISGRLSLPAPTLSFHLKELTRAGLVSGERRGRSIIYRPVFTAVEGLVRYLLDDCCKGACATAQPRIRRI